IIKTRGIEIWSNIHFGMSKKRDMIYFSGVAYFRNIEKVHFSMLDSVLKVTKGPGTSITFALQPGPIKPMKPLNDNDVISKIAESGKNVFYIRPIVADQLNPTETTVT